MLNEIIKETIATNALNESFSIENLHESLFVSGALQRPDHNIIIIITGGQAVVLVDGLKVEAYSNDIVIVSKGEVYGFVNNQAYGYVLRFGNCFWDKAPISANNCKALLFDSGTANRRFSLASDAGAEMAFLFNQVLIDYRGDYYRNKPDALAAYLKIIVIKIANIRSLIQAATGTYDTKLFQSFRLLVQQDFKKQHDVAYYAEKLNVSPRKLHDICRLAGVGPKETINDELAAEARRLLRFTSLSVKEISSTLGFVSPYHFSSFFKKIASVSPAIYRQELVEIGI